MPFIFFTRDLFASIYQKTRNLFLRCNTDLTEG